jgi:hypothetical protein
MDVENEPRDIQDENENMEIPETNAEDTANNINNEVEDEVEMSRVEKNARIEKMLSRPIENLLADESSLPKWLTNSKSYKLKKQHTSTHM